jgi:hypothetical protein
MAGQVLFRYVFSIIEDEKYNLRTSGARRA